jgi:5-methylcytosine-specific restriction endonuclease McrA
MIMLEERDGAIGKVCSKCKIWKPVERFSPRKANRDGYQSQCKPCNNAPNTTRQPIAVEFKECTICLETKPVSEFYPKKYAYDGYRSACKQCIQASIKYHRELDIDVSRARERERYARARSQRSATRRARIATQLEKHQAYMRAWRQKNKDRFREYRRRSFEKNPERRRAVSRRSYQKHREKMLAIKKAYAQAHPELRLMIWHRYRARKKGNGGSFTPKEWTQLKARYDYTCLRCGQREPDIRLTVDHVIPISEGGHDDIGNIQPLCGSCNSAKGARHIDYREKAKG